MYERDRHLDQHGEYDDYDPLERADVGMTQSDSVPPCLERILDRYESPLLRESLIGLRRRKRKEICHRFPQTHSSLPGCLLAGHCRPLFLDEAQMPLDGLSHPRPDLRGQGSREQNGFSQCASLLANIFNSMIEIRPYPRRVKSDQETQDDSQRCRQGDRYEFSNPLLPSAGKGWLLNRI